MPSKRLTPNEHGDWINLRNDKFDEFIPLNSEKKFDIGANVFFNTYSRGVCTSRDSFVYNYSKEKVINNAKMQIDFYNSEVERTRELFEHNPSLVAEKVVNYDSTKFSWDAQNKWDLEKGKLYEFGASEIRESMYRPFCKEWLYFDKDLNNMRYQMPKLFPKDNLENLIICTTGLANRRESSPLISYSLVDLHSNGDTQCFPLYWYEEHKDKEDEDSTPYFGEEYEVKQYTRKEAVTDFILKHAQEKYGNVTKEDIFYYVYGILHSPSYKEKFKDDLFRSLAKLPLVKERSKFFEFSKAGRELAELHLNYESVKPLDSVVVTGEESGNFTVDKMRFPSKEQKDTIKFNNYITVSNIPLRAYDYVINGRSAIGWIMEFYQVVTDKKTGIVNDPNDWSKEHGNPRYILDLLLSIIAVSIKTLDIVDSLPEVDWDNE